MTPGGVPIKLGPTRKISQAFGCEPSQGWHTPARVGIRLSVSGLLTTHVSHQWTRTPEGSILGFPWGDAITHKSLVKKGH